MQQDQQQETLKELQKIALELEKDKQLKIINLNAGKGFLGQVVIAQNLITKSHHPVKIISIFDGSYSVSELKLEEAKKEAMFLKNANHPNIAKYVDEFQIGFNYFVVMEKFEKNMQQFIEEFTKHSANISKHQFVSLACQTLSAINYLHQQKQMLRDLSLRNILIDSFNQIKLCDFGLAKQVQEERNSQLMLTLIPKRTLFYYPEDILAFGICFYQLAGTPMNTIFQIKKTGYKDLPQLDQSLNQILSQILSLNPIQRPTVLKMINLFENLRVNIWTSNDAAELFKEFEQKKQANQWYLAYQLINLCSQIEQKNENYWYYLGKTQAKLKMYNEAIKSYQKCLEINPEKDTCCYNLGIAYKEKGMLDEAIKQYEKYLQINPKDDDCHFQIGFAYFDKGMLDEAIKSYQKCLKINPKKDIYNYNLGIAYQKKGMLDEAISQYEKYLEINPKDNNCHYNLGIAYKAKGMLDKAIKSYEKYIEINPNDDSCYCNLGNVYSDKKMLDEAIKSYEKCLEINPKNNTCLKNLGNAYNDKGMLNEAIKSYEKYLERNPQDDSCHMNLGNTFFQRGLDQAIKSYQKCLEINPKNATCHCKLGNAYKMKGMLDEAIKSYKKCLETNPNDSND